MPEPGVDLFVSPHILQIHNEHLLHARQYVRFYNVLKFLSNKNGIFLA